jgi:demethylmenaquinone methyltransferase / 2-methoxy-6-polyprenyl-1,4-benzoquinol methylase
MERGVEGARLAASSTAAPDPGADASATRPPGTPVSARTRHARGLFSGIPANYDLLADVLSFGQNRRWRRTMVDRARAGLALMPTVRPLVLDVATGPAAVARDLARRVPDAAIVGIDQSPEMLGAGVARVREEGMGGRVRLLLGQAERLPFADATFDAVTFTYLLRYVDDPAGTLRELTRVLKPGGMLGNLEFAVPTSPLWRPLWVLYTRTLLPMLGRLVSRSWFEVGRFLGPSISGFYRRYPLVEQLAMWRRAGVRGVRAKPMSLGGGIVIWGAKEA